jgi:hypothetical protein
MLGISLLLNSGDILVIIGQPQTGFRQESEPKHHGLGS